MRWFQARWRFVLTGALVHVLATGCSNPFLLLGSGRDVGRPAPVTEPAGDKTPSRSDRLRGDLVNTSAPEPVSARPEPLPLEPLSEATPARSSAEPDPRDVIDWLLKEKR
jgi:hypothetical protein